MCGDSGRTPRACTRRWESTPDSHRVPGVTQPYRAKLARTEGVLASTGNGGGSAIAAGARMILESAQGNPVPGTTNRRGGPWIRLDASKVTRSAEERTLTGTA